MEKQHKYEILNRWTGNLGLGTSSYGKYGREHQIIGTDKILEIPGSSDPSFRGDPKRYNPEELLVGSISACHMLWYLHLCSANGIVVNSYVDHAEGTMVETENGSGRFSSVHLKPHIVVASEEMIKKAIHLHEKAHKMCFIANSCNFRIECHPEISVNESAL